MAGGAAFYSGGMDEPFEIPFRELPVWWRAALSGDEAEMWALLVEERRTFPGPEFDAYVIRCAANDLAGFEEGLAETSAVMPDDEARRLFGYLCGAALRGTGVQGEAAAEVRELYRDAARRWSESAAAAAATAADSEARREIAPGEPNGG